jgi:DNA-binding XRE family transcriptional regulator
MNDLKFPARCKTKFQQWRKRYAVSIPDAAQLFGVTEKTVRNWDKREAPLLALRMVQIFERDLGGLHPTFRGISIRPDGKLYLGAMIGSRSGNVGLSAEHLRQYPAAINRLHQLENDIATRAHELVRQLHHLGHTIDVGQVVQALEKTSSVMIA